MPDTRYTVRFDRNRINALHGPYTFRITAGANPDLGVRIRRAEERREVPVVTLGGGPESVPVNQVEIPRRASILEAPNFRFWPHGIHLETQPASMRLLRTEINDSTIEIVTEAHWTIEYIGIWVTGNSIPSRLPFDVPAGIEAVIEIEREGGGFALR